MFHLAVLIVDILVVPRGKSRVLNRNKERKSVRRSLCCYFERSSCTSLRHSYSGCTTCRITLMPRRSLLQVALHLLRPIALPRPVLLLPQRISPPRDWSTSSTKLQLRTRLRTPRLERAIKKRWFKLSFRRGSAYVASRFYTQFQTSVSNLYVQLF